MKEAKKKEDKCPENTPKKQTTKECKALEKYIADIEGNIASIKTPLKADVAILVVAKCDDKSKEAKAKKDKCAEKEPSYCEWKFKGDPPCDLRRCKSYELRMSNYIKCECGKRNGLQDKCQSACCQGRKICMTMPDPKCCPSKFPRKYAKMTHGLRKEDIIDNEKEIMKKLKKCKKT